MAEHDATPPADGYYWFQDGGDPEVVFVHDNGLIDHTGTDQSSSLVSRPAAHGGRYLATKGRLLGRIPEPNAASRLQFPIAEENGQPATLPMSRAIAYPLDGTETGTVSIAPGEAAAIGSGTVRNMGSAAVYVSGFGSHDEATAMGPPAGLSHAVERYLALLDRIKTSGAPPHPDYWHQSIDEARAAMRAALPKRNGSTS
jgi:hypothetical protein